MAVMAAIEAVGAVAGAVGQVINLMNQMDADRSVLLQIDNNTDLALWRESSFHGQGGWALPPESDLPARTAMVFGSRDRGFMTGTTGEVVFSGDGFQLWSFWSNPYYGSNVSASRIVGRNGGKFFARTETGAGNSNAHMRFELFHSPRVGDAVRYGAEVRLRHLFSYRTLHSHNRSYHHGGSSGQQQVTCFAGADENDLFRVKTSHAPSGAPPDHADGDVVSDGDVIRLEHVATGRNLHSHAGIQSPVTGQQEVTCFGENGEGDENDNWRLECPGQQWAYGDAVRLIHTLTNHALHSHLGPSDAVNTSGQQEVTCFEGRDDNDLWAVYEYK